MRNSQAEISWLCMCWSVSASMISLKPVEKRKIQMNDQMPSFVAVFHFYFIVPSLTWQSKRSGFSCRYEHATLRNRRADKKCPFFRTGA
jgi:hypothetical protein